MPTYTVTKFPIYVALDPVNIGNTWDGLAVTSMTSDGTTFSANLSAVKMSFVKSGASAVALALTSAAGDITIDDASTWAFTVDAITPWALADGHYFWSIECTDADGDVKTYFYGTLQTVADAVGYA